MVHQMREDGCVIASLQDQVSRFQTNSAILSDQIAKLEAELQEYRDYYQAQGGDDVYTVEPYLDEEKGTNQDVPEHSSGVGTLVPSTYTAEETAENKEYFAENARSNGGEESRATSSPTLPNQVNPVLPSVSSPSTGVENRTG